MAKYIFTSVIHYMQVTGVTNNTSFKGYDVLPTPLRGLYMQGWQYFNKQNIIPEMAAIAKKENLALFINNCGRVTKETNPPSQSMYGYFSTWAQDTKNFLFNGGIKTLICNMRESNIRQEHLGELSDFKVDGKRYIPRGGNFYIGYKPDGEKWMLISSKTLLDTPKSIYNDNYRNDEISNGLYTANELVKVDQVSSLFDIKPENIKIINSSFKDLDMLVRPIGYPYVLVNDCNETMKNMIDLYKKYPDFVSKIDFDRPYFRPHKDNMETANIANELEELGFIPIKIAGAYFNNINFLNALAFRTEKGGISYITNSTRDSYPEIAALEKIFEKDLRAKVDNIENVYFVSGGNARKNGYPIALSPDVNAIMYKLAELNGGIHCLTAEIPDFDKLLKYYAAKNQ